MLPSSHSRRGRWTCRSTARIKLRSQCFCFFDCDEIADRDWPAVDDAGDHAAWADEFIFQACADLIHAKARFADLRDLEHRALTEPHAGAGWEAHDVEALNCQILFDRARFDADLVERLLVGEEHLAVRRSDGMLVALDPNASNQVAAWHRPHRLAVARTQLNRDNPCRHGLKITGCRAGPCARNRYPG